MRPQFKPKHPPAAPEAIKAARLAAGLTMPDAASLVQVSAASWEDWESGRHRMPAPVWKLFRLLLENPQLNQSPSDLQP